MPGHGGNQIYNTAFGMLAQCAANQITWSGRFKYVIFGNWVYFLRYERKLKVDQDFIYLVLCTQVKMIVVLLHNMYTEQAEKYA